MSKIDFEGKYGSAGSKEVYFARIRVGLGLEKASFNGDRSAAGRYAAQQRWKGHKKDATKPVERERFKSEKFQQGPILKNGYDNFGFPKLLTSAEAKERFGETVTMQKAYFAGRGLDLSIATRSDGSTVIDTEQPAYFAILQALDDVLDQVDTTKLIPDAKNGLIPQVFISDQYGNEETTGGYFESYGNDVAVFTAAANLIERSYKLGQPFNPVTVPQVTVDAINGNLFGGDSISARVAYGFTVHEMGHWLDHALGNTNEGHQGFWSESIYNKVTRNPQNASDEEMRFGSFERMPYTNVLPGTVKNPMGTQYSNTAPVERFAENFTAWFTLTRVNEWRINNLKYDLIAQGGSVAVGAALEVLKQGRIVDNLLDWPSDHPVFLFAFRGEPFDVDALKQQVLVGMIKASFGGDRSAAGRYAANMRWRGHAKVAGFVGKNVYELGDDGSKHPKALLEEMMQEHPDGSFGYETITKPEEWKAVVCKNIATNMSDVSATEILDVLDGFRATNKNPMSSISDLSNSQSIREVLDGTVEKFILTKDGTVIDASKEDYVARQLKERPAGWPKDSLENYWDEKTFGGSQVFDTSIPEGQIAIKQATIKFLVDAWATTANDAYELSLAIQDTAQKVFKVDALSWNSGTADSEDWGGGMAMYSNKDTYKPSSTITDARTKVLSSFLLAQYAATQQYFDAKGIKEITLFRGMKTKPTDPDRELSDEYISPLQPPEKAEILMRPLSSWATRIDEAAFFARGSHGNPFGTIVKARIKTKDILSIPLTGVGCYEEAEVVVIGHPVEGSFRAGYRTEILTDDQRREYSNKVWEWADEDETGEAP